MTDKSQCGGFKCEKTYQNFEEVFEFEESFVFDNSTVSNKNQTYHGFEESRGFKNMSDEPNYKSYLQFGSISPHATIRRTTTNSRKGNNIDYAHVNVGTSSQPPYSSSTLRVRGKHANLTRLGPVSALISNSGTNSVPKSVPDSPQTNFTPNSIYRHPKMVFSEYRNRCSPVPVIDENYVDSFDYGSQNILKRSSSNNNFKDNDFLENLLDSNGFQATKNFQKSLSDILSLVRQRDHSLSGSDLTIVSELSRNSSLKVTHVSQV